MSRVLQILFNTEMVQAILDGRKTVTRRLVKPHYRENEVGFQVISNAHTGKYVRVEYYDEWEEETRWMPEPYHIRDTLYVRETYCPDYFDFVTKYGNMHGYKADYDKAVLSSDITEPKWCPSIHMPKQAARIWLKVTDVRVERLKEITESQAESEGFINTHGFISSPDNEYAPARHTAREHFISTFLKMYPGCTEDSWVWVIEFERCEKPEEI